MVAGALMLAAAWLAGQPGRSSDFLLRVVPDGLISTLGGLVPGNNSFLLRAYAPAAAIVLAVLLVIGLLGGWLGKVIFGVDSIDGFFDVSTWIAAIVGSFLLLALYRLVTGNRHSSRHA
jgi:hypothetical protein